MSSSRDWSSRARSLAAHFACRWLAGTAATAVAITLVIARFDAPHESLRPRTLAGVCVLAGIWALLPALLPIGRRAFGVVAALAVGAAAAGMVGVVRHKPHERPSLASSFACDAEAGRYHERKLPIDANGALLALTGTVRIHSEREDSESSWLPSTLVGLRQPGQKYGTFGLQIGSMAGRDPERSAHALLQKTDRLRTFGATQIPVALGEPVPFELRWMDRRAALAAGRGALAEARELDFTPGELSLSCSGAEVLYEGLKVESIPLPAVPDGLSRLEVGSFDLGRDPCAGAADRGDVQVRLLGDAHAGAEQHIGVAILNCRDEWLSLARADHTPQLHLERASADGAWHTEQDLSPRLCCDERLGLLARGGVWKVDGLRQSAPGNSRHRFVLELPDRPPIASESFESELALP